MDEVIEAEATEILKELMGDHWSVVEGLAAEDADKISPEQQWRLSVALCVDQLDPIKSRKELLSQVDKRSKESLELLNETVQSSAQQLVERGTMGPQKAAEWIRYARCLKLCRDGVLKFCQTTGKFSLTEIALAWLADDQNKRYLRALRLPQDGLASGFEDKDLEA